MSVQITNQNYSSILYHSSHPVILYCHNSEGAKDNWQMLQLNLFANDNPNVTIGKMNIEKEASLASFYGVQNPDTFKVFKNGKCTASAKGSLSKAQLQQLLNL